MLFLLGVIDFAKVVLQKTPLGCLQIKTRLRIPAVGIMLLTQAVRRKMDMVFSPLLVGIVQYLTRGMCWKIT